MITCSPLKPKTNPPHLLLLLPDQTVGFSLALGLRRHGFAVTCVSNADQAWETIQANGFPEGPVDLVVIDADAPVRTTARFVTRLQELTHEMPVLLISGFPADNSALDDTHSSWQYNLVKPFTLDKLLESISTLAPTVARRAKSDTAAVSNAVN